jgi:hypothetical protein
VCHTLKKFFTTETQSHGEKQNEEKLSLCLRASVVSSVAGLLLVCSLRVVDNPIMQRPAGVTAIAILFLLVAAYLSGVGAIMLASPGTLSMRIGAPLLHGLELAGPYMFLLVGAIAALIGWGLLRLNKWARRAALVAALLGVAMLVPSVSAAATDFGWSLAWSGLGIIVRTAIAWYLVLSTPVTESFGKK